MGELFMKRIVLKTLICFILTISVLSISVFAENEQTKERSLVDSKPSETVYVSDYVDIPVPKR